MPNHEIPAARLAAAAAAVALLVAGCAAGPEAAERVGGGRTPPPLAGETPATVETSGTPGPSATPGPRLSAGRPRTLADGLSVPWAIAFLPDGDALVTERNSARILRVTADGQAREVGTVPGVAARGEGGLMGIAVSPKYEEDHYIFVYFTADDDNRIVRYRYEDGLSDPKVILSGIPNGFIHNGGRIEFGPDGHLYAGTGETGETGLAQDRESLGGKILRMTVDGEAPPGNPFGDSLVWSYGHRNVQGLAWDEAGNMYATEFGQNTFDEVNRIEKGANYGWPEVEGTGGGDRFTDPLLTWSTDEASPSGMAYAGGSLWVAGLRGTRLWQVPVGADGDARAPRAHYEGEYGRLRSVTRAPDGSLWVGTSNRDGRGSPREGDDRILVVPLR